MVGSLSTAAIGSIASSGGACFLARLSLAMTPQVAGAFRHEHSTTTLLEPRLRDAIGSRNWPLVGEVAKKLAKQDRQSG
jgi:hypothetical protein